MTPLDSAGSTLWLGGAQLRMPTAFGSTITLPKQRSKS